MPILPTHMESKCLDNFILRGELKGILKFRADFIEQSVMVSGIVLCLYGVWCS